MTSTGRTGTRVAGTALLAAGLLGLTACGDDDGDRAAEAGPLAPISVSAPGTTTAPATTAPGSTTTSGPAGTPATSAPAATTAGSAPTLVDDGAELEVEDQRGDGRSVRVDFARLTSGTGHVVIQTRSGTVLGSAPVTQASQPVTIALQRPVSASGELDAVLHGDDGDRVFERGVDPVVVERDGERESEDFDYRVG